jgi:hypothetical protein
MIRLAGQQRATCRRRRLCPAARGPRRPARPAGSPSRAPRDSSNSRP